MKYQCDIPGFEECWFELSECWTRGEVKQYFLGNNDKALIAAIAPKILAIRLGTDIVDAATLTVERLDALDYRLGLWFGEAITKELERIHAEAQQAATDWRTRIEKQPAPVDRKYICDIPGYADCFVQISDNWTRGDMKRFSVTWGADFLELVRPKLVSISLFGGIDTPAALTTENTDALPYTLWRWLATALQKGKDDLHSMGEATARRSLDGSGKPASAQGNQTQK